MGEVLSDLVRTDNAFSRPVIFVPDLIPTEECIDQPFHIGVLGPVVTLEGSAGQHGQIWFFYMLLCLIHIGYVHRPSLEIIKTSLINHQREG